MTENIVNGGFNTEKEFKQAKQNQKYAKLRLSGKSQKEAWEEAQKSDARRSRKVNRDGIWRI